MNEMHPSIEELVDYMHDELPPERDAAVHAHLAECASCMQMRDYEASLTDLLRAHASAEERELPPSVIAGIRGGIARPMRPAWSPLHLLLRPALAVGAAAAIAAIVYFGNPARHAGPALTRIEAAYYLDNHTALTATTPFSAEGSMPVMLTSDSAAGPADETH
jgi:anti-sigma factor RsiW